MTARTQGTWLVVAQLGLLLALLAGGLWQGHPPGAVAWACWVAGTVLGLWTVSVNRPGNFNIRPEPRVHGHLVQKGPYHWVRHPMYSAVLCLAAGASAWWATAWGWGMWGILLAVLLAKARLEETWLRQRYPDYAAYQASTRRLLPGLF